MVEQHILERLMRQLAARGRQDDLAGCARLLAAAPTKAHRNKLMAGFSKAIEGQALPLLPDALAKQLRQLDNPPLALRVRLGDEVARRPSAWRDRRQKQTSRERIELIRAAGDVDLSRLKATLLGLVKSNRMPRL